MLVSVLRFQVTLLFSMVVNMVALLFLSLSAFGSSSAFGQSFPSGPWNGFFGHLNYIECKNPRNVNGSYRARVRSSAGTELGLVPFELSPHGTFHVDLNQFTIADNIGVYSIEAVDESSPIPNCFTTLYRPTLPGSDKALEYALALPSFESLSGTRHGIFNSFNPQGGERPTANWLTIVNTGSAYFEAELILRNQSGEITSTRHINALPPAARIDLPLGHPDGQLVGMYSVVPHSPELQYSAYVARYSDCQSSPCFAFPLQTAVGTCSPQTLPISTMDPATNWGEILNPTGNSVVAKVELRTAQGELLNPQATEYHLPPFSQRHIHINDYLGERQVGTMKVECAAPISTASRLISQSLFYGRVPTNPQSVEWAYASQTTPAVQQGDAMVFPVNTFLGAANWVKLQNGFDVAGAFELSAFDQAGAAAWTSSVSVVQSGSADLDFHSPYGPNRLGVVIATSSGEQSTIFPDLLRVFPGRRSLIGTIMRTPVTVLREYDPDGSDPGGSSSSGSSSSAGGDSTTYQSECDDGIDNDGDGQVDRSDPGCVDARDSSERDPGGSLCADGLDNDQDGFIDYPIEPGCSSLWDNNEADEPANTRLSFTISDGAWQTQDDMVLHRTPGLLQSINWRTQAGTSIPIVGLSYDPLIPSGNSRIFLHSIINGFAVTLADQSWRYTNLETDAEVTTTHRDLNYQVSAVTADSFTLTVDGPGLRVVDRLKFSNDRLLVSSTLTNTLPDKIHARIPYYLGGLQLGDPSTNDPQDLGRLRAWSQGQIQLPFTDRNGSPVSFPGDISAFSPVSAVWDQSHFSIGFNVLSKLYLPDEIQMVEYAYSRHNGASGPLLSYLLGAALEPGESRNFVFVFKLAAPGDWRDSLTPYRDWFNSEYAQTPLYCPADVFVTHDGRSSPRYDTAAHRYRSTSLEEIFSTDAKLQFMSSFGIPRYGIWETAFDWRHVSVDGTSHEDKEAWIDILDPGISAGRDPNLIDQFTSRYTQENRSLLWFARPCRDIIGAAVTYSDQAGVQVQRGSVWGNDLRRVEDRERAFGRLASLAQRGVRSFYFDAFSCPGSDAFPVFVRREMQRRFGLDVEIVTEGARDRNSAQYPQIPLIHPGNISSELISWLTPQASFHAGKINNPLTDDEIDTVVSRGFVPIPYPFPEHADRLCHWLRESRLQTIAKWNSYGANLGCSFPPDVGPDC